MTRTQICVILCIISTVVGTVIGWKIGEQIGITQLPPNAWAGDGMGILDQSLNGSGWGALVGLGAGAIISILWYLLIQRRRTQKVVLATVPADE